MQALGITSEQPVLGQVERGYYVGTREEMAFLPFRFAPEGIARGDVIRVFVYSDKDGTPIATTAEPFVERGTFAVLSVVDVSSHGIHFDWGLERDLFVPFRLQTRRLEPGDRAVVTVDVDDQGRLFGTTRINKYLEDQTAHLRPGTQVSAMVYGKTESGYPVIVNGRYGGMIYKNEARRHLAEGQEIPAWVQRVREDGRVDLSITPVGAAGRDNAENVVWKALLKGNGFLDLNDKSDPDDIRAALGLSKKQFKKAVGALYRDKRITLLPDGIRVVER